jgi:hypothetical protein
LFAPPGANANASSGFELVTPPIEVGCVGAETEGSSTPGPPPALPPENREEKSRPLLVPLETAAFAISAIDEPEPATDEPEPAKPNGVFPPEPILLMSNALLTTPGTADPPLSPAAGAAPEKLDGSIPAIGDE